MMAVTIDKQREAQIDALQAALAWWEARRPVGWDLRKHLDNPTVNAHSSEPEKALAAAVAAAIEVGAI